MGNQRKRAYVVLQTMIERDAFDSTECPKEAESKHINQAEIDGAQNLYFSQKVQGALMFRIQNAKNPTSFCGRKIARILHKLSPLVEILTPPQRQPIVQV